MSSSPSSASYKFPLPPRIVVAYSAELVFFPVQGSESQSRRSSVGQASSGSSETHVLEVAQLYLVVISRQVLYGCSFDDVI